jgi:HD-GYP domain-containing protein (c-di-GMP phosphodiesterase class II)
MKVWSRSARLYVAALACAALVIDLLAVLAVFHVIPADNTPPTSEALLALAILAPACVLATSLRSSLSLPVSLVVNTPILLASYMIAGPYVAALVGSTDILFRVRSGWWPRVFNASQFALMGFIAGVAYQGVGGLLSDQIAKYAHFPPRMILAAAASDVVAMLVNAVLMVGIMRFAEHVSALSMWRSVFAGSVLPYLAYGLLGLLMAVLWAGSPVAAVLVLIPVLVARWAYQQYAEQLNAYEATIRSLVKAVETKDAYTRGHSERVSRASVLIARNRGMTEDRVALLRYAGILHDVGKLGVPTRVLQKTGPLTDREYALVQRHPGIGQELIRDIAFLREAYEGILHHHERLDGRGYPDGLREEQIPEFARIIAVADAFDSMTSTRSYRGARTVDEALVELDRHCGTQFDPQMVVALIAALEDQPWTHIAVPVDVPEDETPFVLDHDDPTVGMSVAISRARLEDAAAASVGDDSGEVGS